MQRDRVIFAIMPTQKIPKELNNSKFAISFGNTAFSSSFLFFSDHNKISNKAPFLLHTRYRPLPPNGELRIW